MHIDHTVNFDASGAPAQRVGLLTQEAHRLGLDPAFLYDPSEYIRFLVREHLDERIGNEFFTLDRDSLVDQLSRLPAEAIDSLGDVLLALGKGSMTYPEHLGFETGEAWRNHVTNIGLMLKARAGLAPSIIADERDFRLIADCFESLWS